MHSRPSLLALLLLVTLSFHAGCTNDSTQPSEKSLPDFPDYAGSWILQYIQLPTNDLPLLEPLRSFASYFVIEDDTSLIEFKVRRSGDSVFVESIENEDGEPVLDSVFGAVNTFTLVGDTLHVRTPNNWMKFTRETPPDPNAVGWMTGEWRITGSSRGEPDPVSRIAYGVPLLRYSYAEYVVDLKFINDSQVIGSGCSSGPGPDNSWKNILSNVEAVYEDSVVQVTFSNGQCMFGKDHPNNTYYTFIAVKLED